MRNLLVGAAILCGSAGVAAGEQFSFMPVIMQGDAAPGGGIFESLSQFNFTLNGAGQILILADEEGAEGAGTNRSGLWIYDRGLSLVAKAGTAVAGLTPLNFDSWSIGSSGHVAFSGFEQDDGDSVVWAGPPSSLAVVARREQAPNPPFSSYFDGVAVNGSGMVTFHQGQITLGGDNYHEIWGGMPGNIKLIEKADQPAPGTNGTFYLTYPPALSDAGKLAFYGLTTHIGGSGSYDQGIWTGTEDSIEALGTTGMVAPGTGGLIWDGGGFHPPAINSSGTVVFHSALDHSDNDGIWMGTPGALTLVARDGQIAPGTDKLFTGSWGSRIGDGGHVVFRGTLDNDIDGIWVGKPGELRPVMFEGDSVPAAGQGMVVIEPPFDFQINGKGQVALLAILSSLDPDAKLIRGIFFADVVGNAELVIAEGQWLDVRGDLKQIESLWLPAGNDIRLMDNGTMAFYAEFKDGSNGIFFASVPEPGPLLILMAAAAGLSWGRNRHGFGKGRPQWIMCQ